MARRAPARFPPISKGRAMPPRVGSPRQLAVRAVPGALRCMRVWAMTVPGREHRSGPDRAQEPAAALTDNLAGYGGRLKFVRPRLPLAATQLHDVTTPERAAV